MYRLRCTFFKFVIMHIKWPYNSDSNNKKPENVCCKCNDKVNRLTKYAVFNLLEANKDEVQEFLNSFDTVVTDCDGVLWIRDEAVPGSVEAIDYFRKLGKKIHFLTNNSTKTRCEFANKAQTLGFKASTKEVISGSFLVAHYLKSVGFKKKAYVMGAHAIGEELCAVGIKYIGVGPDHVQPGFKAMQMSELDPEVGAVVLGYDKHVSYPKLMKAASYLYDDKCLYLAVDTDKNYNKPGHIILPGVGIFVDAITTLTKRKAVGLGKPHDVVRKYLESLGVNPARTLMIGDTLTTDIEFGVRSGYQTLLVLSGVTTEEDVERMRREKTQPLPDVVLPKLGDLLTLTNNC